MAEPDHFHTFVLIGLQEKKDKWVKSWYKCRHCPIWEYRKAAMATIPLEEFEEAATDFKKAAAEFDKVVASITAEFKKY